MTIHTYIPIYSTPFTQPTYYNHLLCIWVSRKAMALAVSMLLLEESTIEKATRKGQISRFLLYFHGGLCYTLDSCACRPAFVRESWQLHKHLKTIYSLLIQLFFVYKKLFFGVGPQLYFVTRKKEINIQIHGLFF